VLFNNKIENIELKHTAFSRDLFADGALSAAEWISKKIRAYLICKTCLILNN
jgi:4-hydroxy-tetrahydrodipicolinate reductase